MRVILDILAIPIGLFLGWLRWKHLPLRVRKHERNKNKK